MVKKARYNIDNFTNFEAVVTSCASCLHRIKDYTKVFEEHEWSDSINFTESELYLSANGNIVSGCDWSYDTIDNDDKVRICHIDDLKCQDDLIEAIRAYNVKMEKRAEAKKQAELQEE